MNSTSDISFSIILNFIPEDLFINNEYELSLRSNNEVTLRLNNIQYLIHNIILE